MQLLYTSMNRAEIDILGSLLAEANIAFELRNEQINAIYPGAAFAPELWIIHDEDLAKALAVRDDWRATQPALKNAWQCPICGESLEGQFTSCWKCGAHREGIAQNN